MSKNDYPSYPSYSSLAQEITEKRRLLEGDKPPLTGDSMKKAIMTTDSHAKEYIYSSGKVINTNDDLSNGDLLGWLLDVEIPTVKEHNHYCMQLLAKYGRFLGEYKNPDNKNKMKHNSLAYFNCLQYDVDPSPYYIHQHHFIENYGIPTTSAITYDGLSSIIEDSSITSHIYESIHQPLWLIPCSVLEHLILHMLIEIGEYGEDVLRDVDKYGIFSLPANTGRGGVMHLFLTLTSILGIEGVSAKVNDIIYTATGVDINIETSYKIAKELLKQRWGGHGEG